MSKTKKKTFVNPFNNPGVGRRTGVNVLEGKTIRKLSNGMDNFDDYWSETSVGDDSLAALTATPTPKLVAAVTGNSSLRSMTPFSAGSQGTSALVDISTAAVPTITIEPAGNARVDSPNIIVEVGSRAASRLGASRLGVSANPSFTLNPGGDETGTISRNDTARSRTEPNSPVEGFKTKKRLTYSAGSDGKLATPSSTQESIDSTDSFAKPAASAPKRSTRASSKQQSAQQVPEEQVSTKEKKPQKKTPSRSSPRIQSFSSMGQTNPDPIAAVSDTTLEQSDATPSFEDHTHRTRTRSARSATSKQLEEGEANASEENNNKKVETRTEESVEDEEEENESEVDEEIENSEGQNEPSGIELDQNDSVEAEGVEKESEVDEEIEHSTGENEQSGNELDQNNSVEAEVVEKEIEVEDEIEHSIGENVQSVNDQNDSVTNEVKEKESEVDEEIEHSTSENVQYGNDQNDSVADEVKGKKSDVDEEIEHSTGENVQSGNDSNEEEEEEESQGRDAENDVIETEPDVLKAGVHITVEQLETALAVTQTTANTMSETGDSLSGFISLNPAGITKSQLVGTQGSTGITSPYEEADGSNSSDNDDFAVIIGQDISRLSRKSSIQPANKSLQKSKSIPVNKSKGDIKKRKTSPIASTNTRSYFVMSSDSEDEEQPIQKPKRGRPKGRKSTDEYPNRELKAKATGTKVSDTGSKKKSVTEKSPISSSQGKNPSTKTQTKGKKTKQSSDVSQGSKELVAGKTGRPRGRPRKSIDNANKEENRPPSKSPLRKTKSDERDENNKTTKSAKKQPVKDPETAKKSKTTQQQTLTRSSESHSEQENESSEKEIPQKGKNRPQKGKAIQRQSSARSSDRHPEQESELSEEEIPEKSAKNRRASKSLLGTEAPKNNVSKSTSRKKSLESRAETLNESEEVEADQLTMQDIPVGSMSFSEEEEGYDGDEDEGQLILPIPEDDDPQAMVDESASSSKSAASKRKSILKSAPPSVERRHSESSGDGSARRKSTRKRCAPVAWYNNETSPLASHAAETNNKDSHSRTPGHTSDSDVDDELSPVGDKLATVDDELSPPVLKKGKRKKSQPITETPLSAEVVAPATGRRTIQDGKAQPRKSILKSDGTPRRSIASTHFAEELPIYSSRKSEGPCGLPRYSSASPLHFTNVTRSQTPHVVCRQKKRTKIVPPRTPAEGIRRSRRTKVKPLDWFRNERIIYKVDGSGYREIAGIDSPSDDDVPSKEKKLKQLVRKKRNKLKAPKTPRGLSMHKPFEEEVDAIQTTHIHVVNPETKEEVPVDCIRSRDTMTYRGPLGGLPYEDDPFLMSKAIVQKVFSTGKLLIRPSGSKDRQIVHSDSMIFYIIHGKLGVEIHETNTVLESGDFFFVPQGNTYSIKNLRHEEAKLVFYQHKH